MIGQLRLPIGAGLAFPTHWVLTRDGDRDGLTLYNRHYSARRYRDGRVRKLFVGPGRKLVLILPDLSGLFVWRKFKSKDGQKGLNCAVFRNESPLLSSALILDAENVARVHFPMERRYFTYVNSEETRKRRPRTHEPGWCFRVAGWRECGVSKVHGLTILEKEV